LFGLFLGGEQLAVHTAHEYKTAYEHFLRITSLIENTPELDAKVQRIRRGAGEHAIELKTGERLRFLARSSGSGRGLTGDTVYLDEAFALTTQVMGALLPTLSAVPNPQVIYTSSAPTFSQNVLFELVQKGRNAGSDRLLYCEWGNDGDVLATDRDAWYRANPALGIRINETIIEAELAAMSAYPEEFMRERLGVIITQETAGVLPLGKWRDCADPNSNATTGHAAIAVGPGMSYSALAFCGMRGDGNIHVDVVRHEPGTAWVVEACKNAYADTGNPILLDPRSPSGGLVEKLRAADVPVREVSGPEFVRACASMQDDVLNTKVRHLDQAPLNAAVQAVDVRVAGEAWAFSARASSVDITPLLAVTLGAFMARDATPSAPPAFVDLSDYLDD